MSLVSCQCWILEITIAITLGVTESVRETQIISLVDACVIALLMHPNYISNLVQMLASTSVFSKICCFFFSFFLRFPVQFLVFFSFPPCFFLTWNNLSLLFYSNKGQGSWGEKKDKKHKQGKASPARPWRGFWLLDFTCCCSWETNNYFSSNLAFPGETVSKTLSPTAVYLT